MDENQIQENEAESAQENAAEDQQIWQNHMNTMYAQQQAQSEQGQPENTTGANMATSANQIQNELRNKWKGTAAALHLLGAGEPYLPGSY